ncbi:MAG: hypothetical protein L3J82_00400 [Planctomycetes bacterium]|nr:hypothetical protein [Planctomycetota bacterium]
MGYELYFHSCRGGGPLEVDTVGVLKILRSFSGADLDASGHGRIVFDDGAMLEVPTLNRQRLDWFSVQVLANEPKLAEFVLQVVRSGFAACGAGVDGILIPNAAYKKYLPDEFDYLEAHVVTDVESTFSKLFEGQIKFDICEEE